MSASNEHKRVEIGFSGGATTSVRLPDSEINRLRGALAAGSGWHEVSCEEIELVINLAQVNYLRAVGSSSTIGFSGS